MNGWMTVEMDDCILHMAVMLMDGWMDGCIDGNGCTTITITILLLFFCLTICILHQNQSITNLYEEGCQHDFSPVSTSQPAHVPAYVPNSCPHLCPRCVLV